MVFATHFAFYLDTDLVEYNPPDDYFWALILCPGQGGIARVSGNGESWDRELRGIWTHYATDWLFHSEVEIKSWKIATEAGEW